MKRYSFFDFDGTLTSKDTLPLFMRHAIGLPRTIAAFIYAVPAIAAWKLKRISNSEAKERLFSLGFKGMKVEEFRDKGRTFAEKIQLIERPEVVAALKESAARGDNTAIVSASMGSWIRPWAERLDFIRVISTEPEVKRGRLTGRFATPNCHGPEKRRRILEAYPELETARSNCRVEVWGDSSGDDEMLKLADISHKV